METDKKLKLEAARKAYTDKIKSGELQRVIPLDPIEKAKKNPKSLRAAINAKCYECSCYERIEVTKCTAKDCPLYDIRPWQREQEETVWRIILNERNRISSDDTSYLL